MTDLVNKDEQTPRCDKLSSSMDSNDDRAWASLARQLERELSAFHQAATGLPEELPKPRLSKEELDERQAWLCRYASSKGHAPVEVLHNAADAMGALRFNRVDSERAFKNVCQHAAGLAVRLASADSTIDRQTAYEAELKARLASTEKELEFWKHGEVK